MPILGNAGANRAVEILQRIIADAGLGVGRDVGRIDRPHRGAHLQSAGEGFAAFGGMAGDAITGAGEIFAFAGGRLRLLCMQGRTCARQQYGEGGKKLGKKPELTHDSVDNS